MRFSVQISEMKPISPLFSRCKIRVLYSGLNRNNSFITESAINNAIPSIYNIPIVGEFNEDDQNFGGHGGTIDVSGDKPKWVNTTRPYGLVAESSEVYWEDVEEKDGKTNRYLTVDGAYLWTGRYPEAALLVEQKFNQSMEIEIKDGKFTNIDGRKVYEINDFLFSALCILGIDKESDPDGHVEPCFESGSIVAYSKGQNLNRNLIRW